MLVLVIAQLVVSLVPVVTDLIEQGGNRVKQTALLISKRTGKSHLAVETYVLTMARMKVPQGKLQLTPLG